VCIAAGDRARARSIAQELFELLRAHPVFAAIHLPNAFRSILALGLNDEAAAAARTVRPGDAPFLRAQQEWMLASVTESDDPATMLRVARQLWEAAEPRGHRYWPAVARIDAARASIRLGDDDAVPRLLAEAKASAQEMGATRLLDQIAALERGDVAASG
jgi:hypothetical protein